MSPYGLACDIQMDLAFNRNIQQRCQMRLGLFGRKTRLYTVLITLLTRNWETANCGSTLNYGEMTAWGNMIMEALFVWKE